jgi:type IV secretory pathway VirB2 component (pilin)
MKKTIKKGIKNTHYGLMAVLIALPVQCFANGGSTPISILQQIIDYLTGDLARLVGVLVVVVAGYLLLGTQQIQKMTFVYIVAGMGLILGGSTLADQFWG